MSLSPESYAKAIGIAKVESQLGRASCLVYLDDLVGESPSGCDGWPLQEKDGLIYAGGWLTHEFGPVSDAQIFPPWVKISDEEFKRDGPEAAREKIAERKILSKLLCDQVKIIRERYLTCAAALLPDEVAPDMIIEADK